MEVAVVVGVLVVITMVAGARENAQQKALEDAEAAYRASLEALAGDSQNNRLRQDALDLGRAFAALARKRAGSKGVAVFDEVALSNDMTACLGSSSQAHGPTVACPMCAEQIQPAARICRYCGTQFVAQGQAA